MTLRFRPPSNRDIGLQVKLNQEAERHNGEGYDRFRWYRSIGLNRTAMAKLYNVNSKTMDNWWKQDDEEQAGNAT